MNYYIVLETICNYVLCNLCMMQLFNDLKTVIVLSLSLLCSDIRLEWNARNVETDTQTDRHSTISAVRMSLSSTLALLLLTLTDNKEGFYND